jgi:hypothetical protein
VHGGSPDELSINKWVKLYMGTLFSFKLSYTAVTCLEKQRIIEDHYTTRRAHLWAVPVHLPKLTH